MGQSLAVDQFVFDQGMQQAVFEVLNIPEEEQQEKFGFLLDALRWCHTWWFGIRPRSTLMLMLVRLQFRCHRVPEARLRPVW